MLDTGERHILKEEFKTKAEQYNHFMHIATYMYAEEFVNNMNVLDYGSGSGYGAYLLSKTAKSVTAVDVNKEAILFSKNKYSKNNLKFKCISDLKLEDKYDIITSFQVIEHVADDKKFIQEIKQFLKPGGVLLISTPNKKDRLFNIIQKPWNIYHIKYHIKEYSNITLKNILGVFFNDIEILEIGSESDFVLNEISRTKKQKLITLPCTLFFYPNSIRISLLKHQARTYSILKNLFQNNEEKNTSTSKIERNTFNEKDIIFKKKLKYSTDLLAICKMNIQNNKRQ